MGRQSAERESDGEGQTDGGGSRQRGVRTFAGLKDSCMRVSFQFDRSFSICARSSPSSLPTSPRVLMAAAAPLRPSISVSRLSGRRLRLESGAVAPPESPLPLLPGPAAARSASRRASSSSRRRLSARRFCCTKERGERPDAVSNTRGARRKARGARMGTASPRAAASLLAAPPLSARAQAT